MRLSSSSVSGPDSAIRSVRPLTESSVGLITCCASEEPSTSWTTGPATGIFPVGRLTGGSAIGGKSCATAVLAMSPAVAAITR